MKKFFFAALLAITTVTGVFAAETTTANAFAVKSFKNEFSKASNVNWTVTDEYAKANFTINDQAMEVFYNADGEKICTSKNISLSELPVNAKRNFARRFAGYTVKEAIRMEGTEETAYYISAENEKESVILKVSDNSQISTFKKTKR